MLHSPIEEPESEDRDASTPTLEATFGAGF